jgi:hypothetical protein
MKKTSRKIASTRFAKGRSFVLGRAAFSRVSAVEGITPSKALGDDLRALEKELTATRRAVLAGKYGKA